MRVKFVRLVVAASLLLSVNFADARPVPGGSGAQAVATTADKAPAVVFIIRHAEKPEGEKAAELSPMGFQRAAALPSLFLQPPGSGHLPRLPRPAALFATAPSKHSNRPIETITPLSQALKLRINEDYTDIETAPVAREVLSGKYAGKVVLICWHHGEIPHLAEAFGLADAPHHWDPDVFDKIWMIEWINGQPQLTILPESLLPGDSTK